MALAYGEGYPEDVIGVAEAVVECCSGHPAPTT